MTGPLQVACVQLAPVAGADDDNAARSVAAVASAVAGGAGLVVLPELVTSGYPFESVREARSSALPPDAPIFAEWARAAGDAVVVGGFAERGGSGKVYNSAVLVDRTGVRTVYRKTHLWDSEHRFFTPGTAPPPVIDTAAGRIGVLICYDMEFPEMTRGLAARGAEVLAVPVNWPLVDRPVGERAPEVVIAMAAARVNRLAIACCDRSGDDRGQVWTEGTTIIGADGWVLAETPYARGDRGLPIWGSEPDGLEVVRARLDPARSRDKTISAHNDLLGDRRPDVYAALMGDAQ
ncbi:hypothetical protein KOI35_31910 [Actinoplanes bogorensis]|uniref:CN hydrolase domain-containing protein n=1 Tax=Paractinoplanes bogorensis TaxID=1610840 RepID=A0ABS5YXG9_9ACTN|nr:nitrilase-related carbon-nitrogen hydrolase [Actinoplanes bogorensis]MBU2668126.1 hypothetical protein [Actinoplanes bogorensis]